MTDEDVKVDSDFVKKKNIPRDHKTHAELDAASLAIRDVVHMPVEINIEQVEQKVPSFFVSITTDGIEEVGDHDVAPDDRVHGPGNGGLNKRLDWVDGARAGD